MEREVKMAAKLYEMRDTAKRLLGDKYTGHMAMNGKILQDTATRDKTTPLAVAIAVCKKPGITAMETIFIMSAAVELAEPSNARGKPRRSTKCGGHPQAQLVGVGLTNRLGWCA